MRAFSKIEGAPLDFYIIGNITQIGPREHVATACGTSTNGGGRALLRSATFESRESALAYLQASTIEIGRTLTLRGDRVVDVVID